MYFGFIKIIEENVVLKIMKSQYNLLFCNNIFVTLISGFRRDVDVICGLLGNYTAPYGNYLPTFRDNVSVPSSWVKIPRWKESLWQGNLAARRSRGPRDVTMANRMRGWGGGVWMQGHSMLYCGRVRNGRNMSGMRRSMKMGPTRCPETSVNNYHTTPCNYPKDRRLHQHRGGSLKSLYECIFVCVCVCVNARKSQCNLRTYIIYVWKVSVMLYDFLC
jgi:hypothetical protein